MSVDPNTSRLQVIVGLSTNPYTTTNAQNAVKSSLKEASNSRFRYANEKNEVESANILRWVYETIKGFFGGSNRCNNKLATLCLMREVNLLKEALQNTDSKIDTETLNAIERIAVELGISPSSRSGMTEKASPERFFQSLFSGNPESPKEIKEDMRSYYRANSSELSKYLAEFEIHDFFTANKPLDGVIPEDTAPLPLVGRTTYKPAPTTPEEQALPVPPPLTEMPVIAHDEVKDHEDVEERSTADQGSSELEASVKDETQSEQETPLKAPDLESNNQPQPTASTKNPLSFKTPDHPSKQVSDTQLLQKEISAKEISEVPHPSVAPKKEKARLPEMEEPIEPEYSAWPVVSRVLQAGVGLVAGYAAGYFMGDNSAQVAPTNLRADGTLTPYQPGLGTTHSWTDIKIPRNPIQITVTDETVKKDYNGMKHEHLPGFGGLINDVPHDPTGEPESFNSKEFANILKNYKPPIEITVTEEIVGKDYNAVKHEHLPGFGGLINDVPHDPTGEPESFNSKEFANILKSAAESANAQEPNSQGYFNSIYTTVYAVAGGIFSGIIALNAFKKNNTEETAELPQDASSPTDILKGHDLANVTHLTTTTVTTTSPSSQYALTLEDVLAGKKSSIDEDIKNSMAARPKLNNQLRALNEEWTELKKSGVAIKEETKHFFKEARQDLKSQIKDAENLLTQAEEAKSRLKKLHLSDLPIWKSAPKTSEIKELEGTIRRRESNLNVSSPEQRLRLEEQLQTLKSQLIKLQIAKARAQLPDENHLTTPLTALQESLLLTIKDKQAELAKLEKPPVIAPSTPAASPKPKSKSKPVTIEGKRRPEASQESSHLSKIAGVSSPLVDTSEPIYILQPNLGRLSSIEEKIELLTQARNELQKSLKEGLPQAIQLAQDELAKAQKTHDSAQTYWTEANREKGTELDKGREADARTAAGRTLRKAQKKLSDLQKSFNEAPDHLASKELELAAAQEILKAQSSAYELSDEIAKLQENLYRYDQDLANIHPRVMLALKETRAALKKREADIERDKAFLQALPQDIEHTQKDRSKLKEDYENQQKKIEGMQTNQTNYLTQSKANPNNKTLREQLVQLEEEILTEQRKARKLYKKIEKKEKALQIYQTNLQNLPGKIAAQEAALAEARLAETAEMAATIAKNEKELHTHIRTVLEEGLQQLPPNPKNVIEGKNTFTSLKIHTQTLLLTIEQNATDIATLKERLENLRPPLELKNEEEKRSLIEPEKKVEISQPDQSPEKQLATPISEGRLLRQKTAETLASPIIKKIDSMRSVGLPVYGMLPSLEAAEKVVQPGEAMVWVSGGEGELYLRTFITVSDDAGNIEHAAAESASIPDLLDKLEEANFSIVQREQSAFPIETLLPPDPVQNKTITTPDKLKTRSAVEWNKKLQLQGWPVYGVLKSKDEASEILKNHEALLWVQEGPGNVIQTMISCKDEQGTQWDYPITSPIALGTISQNLNKGLYRFLQPPQSVPADEDYQRLEISSDTNTHDILNAFQRKSALLRIQQRINPSQLTSNQLYDSYTKIINYRERLAAANERLDFFEENLLPAYGVLKSSQEAEEQLKKDHQAILWINQSVQAYLSFKKGDQFIHQLILPFEDQILNTIIEKTNSEGYQFVSKADSDYEALGIAHDATGREMRLAFLSLSSQNPSKRTELGEAMDRIIAGRSRKEKLQNAKANASGFNNIGASSDIEAETNNAFATLDLDKGASWVQVRDSYHSKMLQYHPDKQSAARAEGEDHENYAARINNTTQEINAAFDILKKHFGKS